MKTTVNGKEIKLFNRESIEELYTKCVKNYLDVGDEVEGYLTASECFNRIKKHFKENK